MATVRASAILEPVESATSNVKRKEPARVGLPETVPSDPMDRPGGSFPALSAHV
jgi:hypothetical protein